MSCKRAEHERKAVLASAVCQVGEFARVRVCARAREWTQIHSGYGMFM